VSGKRLPNVPFLATLVVLVLAGGGALAITAGAADPNEGTISLGSVDTGWNGKHYAAGVTVLGDACAVPDPSDTLCDHYELTVDVPKSHWEDNDGGVEVRIAWDSEEDDFDLAVFDAGGNLVDNAANGGTSAERVFIPEANSEDGPYSIEVNPYTVTESGYLGGAYLETRADVGPGGGEVPTEPLSGLSCSDGLAGPFPCDGIDLEGFLPTSAIGGGELNDIWGWTDPETGNEYALIGKTTGTAFVDLTDPRAPRYLGDLPSHQSIAGQPVETIFNVWSDIKVHDDHAFIVKEEPLHGMQVFDLTRLRGVTEERTWSEDAHYSYVLDGTASVLEVSDRLNTLDNAHNIAINEESGFAYAIGTSTCGGGGPHVIDIREPKNPKFAGCVSEDGYTHDTQCVNYREGDPDGDRFGGREICFSSNEDSLTIVDVTDKDAPVQLSRLEYEGSAYTHQGWLTPDRRHFLVGDELDETDNGLERTRTYIFNVERLDMPGDPVAYDGDTEAIDHNMYTKGSRVYQANYRAGLRVLDTSDVDQGTMSEVGFFDVYPEDDLPEFNGAWSNYPYFASGNVIVSGIEQGLFVLRPTAEVAG